MIQKKDQEYEEYEQAISQLNPSDSDYKEKVLRLKKELVRKKVKQQLPRFILYLVVIVFTYFLLRK